jgi:glycosyltransferase involved in cell wall biosynthesis
MSSTSEANRTHLVIIPSFNTGSRLLSTVREALTFWEQIWVIIDGSTDESAQQLRQFEQSVSRLKVFILEKNQGKGAAVLYGMRAALAQGFRYALVMDADGQHPAERIPEFMALSNANPQALVLGLPEFGSEAPRNRVQGHRIANFWTNVETLWGGIGDSLFGFRVYPIGESIQSLEQTRRGRRFDFDTQLAVRLFWLGFQPINVKVPVRYFKLDDGGVSHFKYLRDNLLLIRAHAVLLAQMPWRMLRRPKIGRPYGSKG